MRRIGKIRSGLHHDFVRIRSQFATACPGWAGFCGLREVRRIVPPESHLLMQFYAIQVRATGPPGIGSHAQRCSGRRGVRERTPDRHLALPLRGDEKARPAGAMHVMASQRPGPGDARWRRSYDATWHGNGFRPGTCWGKRGGCTRLPTPAWLKSADVFHSTFFTRCPVRGPAVVVTVYDMIPERLFSVCGNWARWQISTKKARSCAATICITISTATAEDLKTFYPEVADRIRVIHLGAEHLFGPARPADCDRSGGTSEPFAMYVGLRREYEIFPYCWKQCGIGLGPGIFICTSWGRRGMNPSGKRSRISGCGIGSAHSAG